MTEQNTQDWQSLNELLNRSLVEIRRLKAANQTLRDRQHESIAIVGAACRYPGNVRSVQELWAGLRAGIDGIRLMSNERWPMQHYCADGPEGPGAIYSRAAGLLEDVDQFDAARFALKAAEARYIDPQHRLLLEMAWETLEDAGYPVEAFSGSRTGVYVGIMNDDYAQLQGPLAQVNPYVGSGLAKSCAAGRVAFTFGLQGPALALDTACSSSLVAIHLAVQALRRGECDAALAGGVNLILSPHGTVVACSSQMLSKAGHCQTFDASADGYVRSEGCGLILLKRLKDAQRDNDHVYALIRGSAVNHDGRSQGLTAPNGQAQRSVIGAALEDAGVKPEEVTFVECHGTGTPLGDPVEVRALQASYLEPCTKRAPLWLGAVKSNLGHLESAAGILGVHKAMQVVRHREVPPNLHFRALNPQIRIDPLQIQIPIRLVPLEHAEPLRAAVSSFGFSGTNAHIILESYPAETSGTPLPASRPVALFKLAAPTSAALADYARHYLSWLSQAQPHEFDSICYTAATGRSDAPHRIAFTADNLTDLRACLAEYLDVVEGDEAPIPARPMVSLWIFDGEDPLDWSGAALLYDHLSFYREAVDTAYQHLSERAPGGLTLFRQLCNSTARATVRQELLAGSVHRLALAQLLLHFGLRPNRMAGFGYGELLAASAAGVLSPRDVLESIAAGEVSANLRLQQPRCEVVCGRTGQLFSLETWRGRHIMSEPANPEQRAVILGRCGEYPDAAEGYAQIEIGDGLATRLTGELPRRVFRWVHGGTNRSPRHPLKNQLAQLYMAGASLHWTHLYADRKAVRMSLPPSPFQRERHWLEGPFACDPSITSTVGRPAGELQAAGAKAMGGALPVMSEPLSHPLLHTLLRCPSGLQICSGNVSLASLPSLRAHRILGELLLPASVYLDLALTIGASNWPATALLAEELELLAPCVVGREPVEIYCQFQPVGGVLEIHTRASPEHHWQLNARTSVRALREQPAQEDLSTWKSLCRRSIAVPSYYEGLERSGMEYGREFQGITELSAAEGHALARITLPALQQTDLARHRAHPVLLDCCLQAIAAADHADDGGEMRVPSGVRRVRHYHPLPASFWCLVQVAPAAAQTRSADLTVLDDAGHVLLIVEGFTTTPYGPAVRRARSITAREDWFYEKHWAAMSLPENDSEAQSRQHVVLFSNQDPLSRQLEAQLRTHGAAVTVVCRNAPASASEILLTDPSAPACSAALAAATAAGGGITDVVYAWSLQPSDPESLQCQTALEINTRYPLGLCQALLESGYRDVTLTCLTCGTQAVNGSKVSNPLAATLWGHVATFSNENARYARLLDLDLQADRSFEEAARAVIRDLVDRAESQIAWRSGQRYVVRLHPAAAPAGDPVPLSAAASYLITGGLGALGLQSALRLSERGARHLILLGRDLTKAQDNPILEQLRTDGVALHLLQADLADAPTLIPRLRALLEQLPPLRGVIHSAGVLADGIVANQTWERYSRVFGPKISGTLNLLKVVRQAPLDFCIFYSSAAALLGNPGQANYAAANAFLDSFAWYLRGEAIPASTLNWAGWSQLGLAARTAPASGREEELIGLIPVEVGSSIIASQLGARRVQLAILPLQLRSSGTGLRSWLQKRPLLHQMFADLLLTIGGQAAGDPASSEAAAGAVLRRLRQTQGAARPTQLRTYVSGLITSLLRTSTPLDPTLNLFDAGLDSLLTLQMRQRLEKDLDCRLPSTLLHDYPHIESLVKFLSESLFPSSPEPASQRIAEVSPSAPLPVPLRGERDIAIIAVTGRFPGASDLATFWDNLLHGVDSVTSIPRERWPASYAFSPRKGLPGHSYCQWGGFLEDIDQFDAAFFGLASEQAARLDPKTRLFLETSWNLLEEGGYTREKLQRLTQSRVGVFVGAMYQLYSAFAADEQDAATLAVSSYHEIANTVSNYFQLNGPSIALDTMCSSSLTAIDQACSSLRSGACAMAIAGGVNLSLHAKKYIGLSQAQIIGSHIRSRSFAAGDGFLPAEAVGAVLLKPLSRALSDGDTVLAIIKASLTNHGGHSSGFYAPNGASQAQLLEDNFRRAGIEPATISYVEAAANGASLADAVEIRALTEVYRKHRQSAERCPIGSVKSNIGHAEAASGMAQLTKVILQLQHRMLLPSIHTQPSNPDIDFGQTPFQLLYEAREWHRPQMAGGSSDGTAREIPRRAAISSFGAGGANAHLIVEEYVAPPRGLATPRPELIVLSAKTPEALIALAKRLLTHIESPGSLPPAPGGEDTRLSDIAYTLQTCREPMPCRLAFVAHLFTDLLRGLRQYIRRGQETGPGSAIRLHTGHADAPFLQRTPPALEDIDRVAAHWVCGGQVPWSDLHRDRDVRKTTLPTYQFARATVWLATPLTLQHVGQTNETPELVLIN